MQILSGVETLLLPLRVWRRINLAVFFPFLRKATWLTATGSPYWIARQWVLEGEWVLLLVRAVVWKAASINVRHWMCRGSWRDEGKQRRHAKQFTAPYRLQGPAIWGPLTQTPTTFRCIIYPTPFNYNLGNTDIAKAHILGSFNGV